MANRSQLVSLVAQNTLGQNSPAIEAIQAEYAEMWAQDAAAMYSYAGASEAASTLAPFSAPTQTADPAGPAAQAAAVAEAVSADPAATAQAALAQLLALSAPANSLTSGLSGLASSPTGPLPAAPIQIPTPIGELDAIALYIAAIATGSFALSLTNSFRPWNAHQFNAGALGPTQGQAIRSGKDVLVSAPNPAVWGAATSAGVGHAALLGSLSVPHSWTTAAPEIKLAVETLPSTSTSATPTGLGGASAGLLSGMALASLAGRGIGGTDTRDAVSRDQQGQPERKPTVVVIHKPPPTEEVPPR